MKSTTGSQQEAAAGRLLRACDELLDASLVIYRHGAELALLSEAKHRLSGPVQVAVVGSPGSGTSTIIRALRRRVPHVRYSEGSGSVACPADAELLLLRQREVDDVRLLAAGARSPSVRRGPSNAIGVVARADEVGGGCLDDEPGEALGWAEDLAAHYRRAQAVRDRCQEVVPVAGLLAAFAAAPGTAELETLKLLLEELTSDQLRSLCLSVDRFERRSAPTTVPPDARRALLQRLGLVGVRLTLSILEDTRGTSAAQLADELDRRSGLERLAVLIEQRFVDRAPLLKVQTVLSVVGSVVAGAPGPGAEFTDAIERLRLEAHELVEERALIDLRRGKVELPEEAERLLGGRGLALETRLALERGASQVRAHEELSRTLQRWQERIHDPLAKREARDVARVAVRSCEGMFELVEAERSTPVAHRGWRAW